MSSRQIILINEKLESLGVTEFSKQGDLIQIIIEDEKVISFNIKPNDFQQTFERFRKSALNGFAKLSEDLRENRPSACTS